MNVFINASKDKDINIDTHVDQIKGKVIFSDINCRENVDDNVSVNKNIDSDKNKNINKVFWWWLDWNFNKDNAILVIRWRKVIRNDINCRENVNDNVSINKNIDSDENENINKVFWLWWDWNFNKDNAILVIRWRKHTLTNIMHQVNFEVNNERFHKCF